MTYTVGSSFLSSPIGTVARWGAAIGARNPDEAGAIVDAYFTFAAQAGLNADLCLAQACHECAWFTSRRWREQHNPCGLAITSDDAPGVDFGIIARGIQAHLAHLCCYVTTEDPPAVVAWGAVDPRHGFHDGMPRVADLIRPQRRWAVPGDGYAERIIDIANQVVGGAIMSAAPTPEAIGYPVRIHTAADIGPSRGIEEIRWFIVHDTEGHFAGDEAILTSAAPPVESAHALIAPDGTLVFMTPLDTTAWTPGNDAVARVSVNVELSGFASVGYTEAQYQSLAAFFRWCATQGMDIPAAYVGKDDRPGICGHQDVADPYNPGAWGGAAHHTDPGPLFRWDRLVALITGGDPPARDAPFYVEGNPYGSVPIRPPFWNRWHALDALGLALPMMGYPKAAERSLADGRRVQRFERGWFGTQDGVDPWDVVALLTEEWPAEERAPQPSPA